MQDDAGTLLAGSLSWSQLEPGHFEARREVADLGAVRVVRRAFNLGLRAQGELQPGKVLVGIAADSETKARWFGSEADSDDIAATGRSIDLCTSGPGTFYSATIDVHELEHYSRDLRETVASIAEGCNACLVRDPALAARLRLHLRMMLSAYKQMAETAPVALRTSLERTFLSFLGLLLEHAQGETVRSRSLTRRVAAVRLCEAYVKEHIESNPTLLDLSVISGLRLRSLINAFQAVIGLSPMAYLKRTRLGNARRLLQHADKEHTRIIDVAANLGFWHMGHFAADYRAMFGETPSDTLRGN